MAKHQNSNLLIIFTRNPELGKCKTRLAKTVGDESALEIYKFLLKHTVSITENLNVDKAVYYSVKVRSNDFWSEDIYKKYAQNGDDLGIRMKNAFEQGFKDGYKRIIIIGSDMYDLSQADLEQAFKELEHHEAVIGPAEDGGYYLLGMQNLYPEVFYNKKWGTHTVLKDTLDNLSDISVKQLEERNDVDFFSDIKHIDAFQRFLPPYLDKDIQ